MNVRSVGRDGACKLLQPLNDRPLTAVTEEGIMTSVSPVHASNAPQAIFSGVPGIV